MLTDLQRACLAALGASDPIGRLRRESSRLSPEDRERVERIDVDGFRLTALLVAKLRFERICRGDRSMEAWFHRDPQGFTRAYRAYASEVPPTAFFPQREAADFRRFCESAGLIPTDG